MPMLVETMAEAGESYAALTAVAATVGPGAFTGIRIGLAAARGIGLAADVPVIGVTTFAAVAEAVSEAERAGRALLVLLDSKRGDVFAQAFTAERAAVGAPAILSPDGVVQRLSARSSVIAGDGMAVVRPALEAAGLAVVYSAAAGPADAVNVARLAERSVAEGMGLPPTPLYLRAPEARSASAPAAASDRSVPNP